MSRVGRLPEVAQTRVESCLSTPEVGELWSAPPLVSGDLAADVLSLLAHEQDGVMTLKEIADQRGNPRASISRAAAVLRERGLVEAAPPRAAPARGGHPVQPVRLSEQQMLLGFSLSDIADLLREPSLDPGGGAFVSRIVGCATTLTGRTLGRPVSEQLTVADLGDTKCLAEAVARLADQLCAAVGDAEGGVRRVAALGVTLGGVIANGVAYRSCNLAWRGPVDLLRALRARFPDWAIAVENDANAVLIADAWRPHYSDMTPIDQVDWRAPDADGQAAVARLGYAQNLVVVLVRPEGIGGAVLIDGRRVTGHRGAAGEIGHVKVLEASNLSCRCGAHGCLEALSSPNRLFMRIADELDPAVKDFETASRIRTGDHGYEAAMGMFSEAGRVLGQQIAAAATWTDPSAILLYLPPPLAHPGGATPGAAYRAGLREALDGVYPAPPDLLVRLLDDADALAAESAAIAAFVNLIDHIRAS